MADTDRIIHKNLWQLGDLGAPTSEHPQFPAVDLETDTLSQFWRSRYGSGSGAGLFRIRDDLGISTGANLITNGNFTTDTDPPPGWTAVQSTLTTEGAGQSGNCLMVENTAAAAGLGYQDVPVEDGKYYRLILYYKNGTAGSGYFNAGTPADETKYGGAVATEGGWTAHVLFFKSSDTTFRVKLATNSSVIGETSYWDEISLYELEEAPNNKIDFEETASTPLVAILTAGDYNGHTLATEIKTRLDAAGASTYTVTYSDTTNKFTLVSNLAGGGNIFTLLWLTGANRGASAADTLGYSDAADDSGAGTYTSDSRRIHWPYEEIPRDLLTAYQYNHIALLGHNFSSSAVIKIIGADDSAFTTNPVSDTITYNANNIFFYLSAARTKRYIKLQVADPENSAGYLQLSVPYPGNYWEPSRKHGSEYGYGMDEISEGEESDSRTYYGTGSKPRLSTYYFDYQNIDVASRVNALDLMDECGIEKAFIFCEDYDNPNSGSYYVQNIELFEARGTIKDRCNWALSVKEVV